MHLSTQHARPRRPRNRVLAAVGALALSAWLPAKTEASGMPRRVLVLGISEEGKQLDDLRLALGSKVERSGALLVSDTGLSDDRRSCDDPGCLRDLAREFGADLLLWARMERHGRFSQLLELWIFDTATNRDVSGKNLCDSRRPEPCVTELGGRLLAQFLDGTPAPSTTRRKPTEAASAPSQKIPATAPFPPYRLALGIGLSLAAATGLGIGIGYGVKQASVAGMAIPCPSMPDVQCGYDYTKLYAPALALAGSTAIAAAITLAWPRPRLAPKESTR